MTRSTGGGLGSVGVLTATLSIILIAAGIGAAAAQQTGLCSGDTVVVFPDARLLNIEGSRSAGPFSVSLEPGTYLVTAGSYDAHGGDQLTQPQEQWQMVADSGWMSPFTVDIADNAQTVVSTFNNQVIESEVSSLTLAHLGQGDINSVTPVCAGFTKLADPAEPSGPDGSDPVESNPDGPDPDVGPPDPGTGGDPDEDSENGNEAEDDDDEDDGATPVTSTTAAPTTPTTVATTQAPQTTAPSGGGSTDDIEPEVQGAVETPDVLARTGATPLTDRILGLGLVLLGVGGLMTLTTRRRPTTG